MVIFGGWHPVRTAASAYLFGGVQAAQLRLQALGISVPTHLLLMTPYVFTIAALTLTSARRMEPGSGAPTALGMNYIRGES
jgi:simple sugar transport system permease protein